MSDENGKKIIKFEEALKSKRDRDSQAGIKYDFETALEKAKEQQAFSEKVAAQTYETFAQSVINEYYQPRQLTHAVTQAMMANADYVDILLPYDPKKNFKNWRGDTQSFQKFRQDFLKASGLHDVVFLEGTRIDFASLDFVSGTGLRIYLKAPPEKREIVYDDITGFIPVGYKKSLTRA